MAMALGLIGVAAAALLAVALWLALVAATVPQAWEEVPPS